MPRVHRWTDRTRLLVQLLLLGGCALTVPAVRVLVDGDALSDPAELALHSTALVVLLASILVSFSLARATQAALARAGVTAMFLLIVGLAMAFVRLTYADVSIELADLIAPAQAAESNAQIVVGPTGDDVRLSGDIKDGAASLLESLLAAHPKIGRIHLTSEGGLADEGQALAEVIAAHHLTTYVPDFCVSACTLAFVGGRERLLMEGARLGFHAPYEEGLLGQTFAGDAKAQRAAYIEAGLSADFVDEALRVAPDDLWIPEKDRLLAAHVVTGYVDRYRFPDSILDGAADGQGARDAVLRNFSMLKSIDLVAPSAIDRIAEWYLRAYRRSASEGEATDGLKKIVSATVVLVLARADDATLVDLARFMQAAIGVEPPRRDCSTVDESVDLAGAAAALERSDKDAASRAERLVARALTAGRRTVPAIDPLPVAFVPRDTTCESLQKDYAAALQHRDTAALRHRLHDEASKAGRLLAPLVAAKF